MKKYLMTGIAALAMVAGFTSCSSSDDAFDYEGNAALTVQTYQENFIKVFGKPAANQTWGFGKAVTRATLDMNGNMANYYNKPVVTKAEEKAVVDYVNMTRPQMRAAGHKWTETAPDIKEYFFVTQVHTGTDIDKNLDKQDVYGASKMNHLMFRESATATLNDINGKTANADYSNTGWYHINNFNGANNTDWGGNTLVIEGGTYDFAYLGSEDSKYHNKWIIVDGKDISKDYEGYYYLCFDFEQQKDGATTNFQVNVSSLPAPFRSENKSGNVEISGAYETADQIIGSGYTTWTCRAWNNNTNQEEDCTITLTADNISNVRVINGNQCVPANDVYTDWIVRIVKAEPISTTPQLRVFAEDLSASEKSDFDFNDVVFDVEYVSASNVKVTIRAAGGTLRLTVADKEVHGALVSVNSQLANSAASWDKANNRWLEGLAIDVKTMINTNARRVKPEDPYKAADNLTPYVFNITNLDNWSNDIDEFSVQVRDRIKVMVEKDGSMIELTANMGEPACKVAVPINKTWSEEKVSLGEGFARYVTDPTYDWCNTNN